MSANLPINQRDPAAPTPQNTPLTHAPIQGGALSRPTVPDITEEEAVVDGDEDLAGEVDTSALPMQQALAGMVQSRLNSLIGKSSGYVESLPVEVKRSLVALQGVQDDYTKLQTQFKREFWELERKYLDLAKPLYDRRLEIIDGSKPATEQEIAKGEELATKEDEDYTPLPKIDVSSTSPAVASIPEFWLTALQNHIGISELITDRDAPALKHLTDIRLSYLPASEEKPGFKLSFHFSPNEYFENEILEKTYYYQAEVDYSGDFLYDHAVGTTIKWKDEKDLTKEFEIKKQRNKNTNRTRLVRKAHPTDSFFNFFSPPKAPSEEQLENDEIDEEELEEIEARLEMDYQIGEDIKERIIPHAVDYFTGKALEYDAEDMEDDEFEDDDDDDDDAFDEDEDDDDDEEENTPQKRRGPPKGRGAGGQPSAEECKQQ